MKSNKLSKLIINVIIFSFLIGVSMQSPMRRTTDHSPRKPKSPGHHHRIKCGVSDHVTHASISHKKVPLTKLLNAVVSPTRKAKQHAERVKLQFLNHMGEDYFESGLEHQRQDWLPLIPSPSLAELVEYSNPDEAYKKAFTLMQYFAVGVRQLLQDITYDEGQLLNELQHLEENLYQILCEVKFGMQARGMPVERYILDDSTMPQELRNMDSGTQRKLRDFLILRDYIKALDFIQHLFNYLTSLQSSDSTRK